MKIYTYQPQSLIEKIKTQGFVTVEFKETNLYRKTLDGSAPQYHEAYMWMARKLAEKTGLWMKDIYGEGLNIPTDDDGDYTDREGQKLPVLPFWGWYLTDGKNQKPDPEMYSFDVGKRSDRNWNVNKSKTMLLTLDIPEKWVLLSDANAWYCVLEGRPCYEYEEEDTEKQKIEKYRKMYQKFVVMPDKTEKQRSAKTAAAEVLWNECVGSWDNILRLEGRRLREFMGEMEKYDIQAVFPGISEKWIIAVEEI